MVKIKTLYVTERKVWRTWLEENFEREDDIWLIYPAKSTGKPRIIYNDAVEEALCFGWIDSTVKKYDARSSIQRFSKRNPKSTYSQANKERLRWLMEHGKVHPSMVERAEEVLAEKYIFPDDIVNALKNDREAWKNFNRFSDPYKRIRVAYIDGARKRPEEFQKRLRNFIEKTRVNKQIGFGGIEKHY